jgi:DNA modification methylase
MNIYRKSEIPKHLQQYFEPAEIGLEPTPGEYVAKMVDVFREVKRVLRQDGVVFLNLGDSYASMNRSGRKESPGVGAKQEMAPVHTKVKWHAGDGSKFQWRIPAFGTYLKPKDLIGIPWRVAFALQSDGWYLRSDIIWAKPNPMPESVKDRPTKAHEYLFLLSKSARYFYDAEAVKEPVLQPTGIPKLTGQHKANAGGFTTNGTGSSTLGSNQGHLTRNKRSVWTIATRPFKGAHFAVMPEALVEPCIKAGCPEGGTVIDPFAGSGTVGVVAARFNRHFIGIELNPDYVGMAQARVDKAQAAAKQLELSEAV